ncbi:hypothetical protein PGIGA_G00070770 [Pangasianodon gigas]|uniref:Uncharacterized protein n=1 Tax=Pangasianodon gigas TaxID=30993 RepID=A0ACC5X7F1_PANGG|nr:hypothetical protein [Pangasianodon gigas]
MVKGGRSGSTAVMLVIDCGKQIVILLSFKTGALSFSSNSWMISVPVPVCGGVPVGQVNERHIDVFYVCDISP